MGEQDNAHLDEKLLQFLEGHLSDSERQIAVEHLEKCNDCRRKLQLIEKLNQFFASLKPRSEMCPLLLTLVRFHYGELGFQTEYQVRQHLINCQRCAGEITALEQEDEICEAASHEHPPAIANLTPFMLALFAILWRGQERRHRIMAAAGDEHIEVKLSGKNAIKETVTLKVIKHPAISAEGRFALILEAKDEDDLEGARLSIALMGMPLGETVIHECLALVLRDLTDDDMLILRDFLHRRKMQFPARLPINGLDISVSAEPIQEEE